MQEGRGGGEDLEVAGPAEALVALRAVGGDVEEVALHPPHHVVVQLGHQRVGDLEAADALHVGVQDLRDDVGRVELAGPAGDLGVAEAVEREPGRPLLDAVAGERVGVGGPRAAQRAGGQLTVLEDLGVAECDDGAGLAADPDPEAADEILAEVQDGRARGAGQDLGHRQPLDAAHRGAVGRHECRDVELPNHDGRPAGGVERRHRPGWVVQAGVEGLPVVEVGGGDRAGRADPDVVGGDHLAGAVGILDLQLGDQAQLLAVQRPSAVPAEVPAPPAVAEPGAQRVVPGPDQVGDVVGHVAQARLVGGPAGREFVVADALTVQLKLRDAVGAGVEPRAGDLGSLCVEVAPEQWRRDGVVGRTDHGSDPIPLLQQPGLDGGPLAPPARDTVGARHPHPHLAPLARGEVVEGPRHEDAVR